MKIAIFLALLTSLSAFADTVTEYNCTVGNPFVDGISDKYSAKIFFRTSNTAISIVEGKFKGEAFSFEARRSYNKRTNITTYRDTKTGNKVEVQTAHPYDGEQDSLWGKITKESDDKVVNCFVGR